MKAVPHRARLLQKQGQSQINYSGGAHMGAVLTAFLGSRASTQRSLFLSRYMASQAEILLGMGWGINTIWSLAEDRVASPLTIRLLFIRNSLFRLSVSQAGHGGDQVGCPITSRLFSLAYPSLRLCIVLTPVQVSSPHMNAAVIDCFHTLSSELVY